MAAIQWRPVPSALTTPYSYSIRFVPRGSAGREEIAADGDYTLSGFAGSPAAGLDIRVDRYAQLKDTIRNDYSARLVDVPDIRIEPA